MKLLAIALALIVCVYGLTEVEYQNAFESFKAQYAKKYLNAEEQHRYTVFKSNLDFINSWDEKEKGFSVAMNEFGDLSNEEFTRIYNGMNIKLRESDIVYEPSVTGVDVDWRTKGAVTPVKNQGQCGSCWSFSATGSMEAAHFLATGRLVSLSEQDLVDCSVPEGNQGCNGGWMDQAFEYVIKNHGIDTESSYPYKATGPNTCQFNAADIGATISGYQDVPRGSEAGLQNAANGRPVSVAIDASHSSFQFYKTGVYYEAQCSATALDHGVLVVGYGSEGADYWIVKNSWGPSWGNKGYINMSRNRNNNCGIASAASIPTA
jgi:cathepsin L